MKRPYIPVILSLIITGLWLFNPSFTESKVFKVRPSVKPLDLSRPPTTEEIMAAGQLGGQLYPTEDIEIAPPDVTDLVKIKHNRVVNLSFGEAIQEWNKHNYKKGVKLFKKHLADYPDSPWASEAVLHIGCDATYHGRYTEAEKSFKWVINNNRGKDHPGAKALVNKAIQRLAVLKVYQNNFTEAKGLFRDLKRDSDDWRERTYAAHWIQRLSRYSKNALAMLNCGVQALAYLLEKDGREADARKVLEILPESTKGHSIKDLSDISSRFGYSLTAVRLSLAEIRELPLPSIMHISAKNLNDSGHYWILEELSGDTLNLFDPQSGRRFQQGMDEFSREWSGNVLVFSNNENIPGIRLSEKEMKQIYGGCCGAPRPEDDQGDPCKKGGGSAGAPSWEVNMLNMNLFVSDTPLWYDSPIGPSVEITLSYNSQSAIAYHEPFGNKWQFNYGSYLIVDTAGEVITFMPDGKRDVYSPDGSGGYTSPYQVFNTLTKIAENHYELKFPDGTVYVYKIPSGTTSLQPFLVEIRDPYSQKLTFNYDSKVQMTRITDAMGRATTLTYNTKGLVTSITDPFGRSATFEYDANNNLIKITDMGGYWSSLSYDSDVYLTSIENAKGKWGFYVEPSDADSKNSDNYPPPGDSMWENYRITITNPLGGKEEYFYYGGCDDFTCSGYTWYVSPRDYIPWQSQEVNNFRSNAPKIRNFFAQTAQTASGQRGEISKVLYPGGGSIEYDYDTLTGDLTRVTDTHGHTTYYAYNNMGNIITITDAKGISTNFGYHSNGVDLLSITDGLGSIIMMYNSAHDIISITDRLGNTTKYTYNVYGQIISMTDASGVITNYTYNSNNELQQIIRDGKTLDSFTYDSMGRVRTHTDITGLTVTYDYNNLNSITKITFADGKSIGYTYSACCPDLVEGVIDRSGRMTTFHYDPLVRLTMTINPEGGTTRFLYDSNDNLLKLVDPNGNATSFEYDRDNRLVKKIYADGNPVSFTYDGAGILTRRTDARGIITEYTYDKNHNLLGVSYADGTPGVTYQYDDYNRMTQMVDGIGTYNYSYDANSRFTRNDGPWTDDAITYQYDSLDNRIGIEPQKGQPISYTYDTLDRLTDLQIGSNKYFYSYADANPLANRLRRPNGSFTDYQYDSLNRLRDVSNRNSASEIINHYVFTHNQQDLRSSETITNGAPITGLTAGTITYSYNTVNQLLSSTNPSKTFTYDSDGNMTQGFTPEGFLFIASYDAENRLKSLEYTDSSGIVHKTEYLFSGDEFLLAIKKYEDGVLVRDTRFVRDVYLTLQERNENNNVLREYTWGMNMGGGIGGLLNLGQNGVDYSYLYDGKGNVTTLIDGSQAVVATYNYDTFGNLMSATGTLNQPVRFSTETYDEETGLLYYGYRFYSPVTGKWLTRESLAEVGSLNLYGFAGSNPINIADITGLYAQVCVNGNNVQVTIPMEYSGAGATREVMQKFNKAIEKRWSGKFGKYKVTTKVTSKERCGKINKIEVPAGNGRAYVNGVGGDTGKWPAERPGWTAAHETGHLMGLDDQYTDAGGANPGYRGNIMAQHGGRAWGSDIRKIIQRRPPGSKCKCK